MVTILCNDIEKIILMVLFLSPGERERREKREKREKRESVREKKKENCGQYHNQKKINK